MTSLIYLKLEVKRAWKRFWRLCAGTGLLLALAAAAALWPLFLLVNVFLDVAALFLRDLEWKVIPHVGAVNNAKAPTS